ncbi:MAG: glycosyltransferase family protein [Polyangiaceae bacterium]
MKILYGVVGEGMGHAMRSRVILEHLVRAKDAKEDGVASHEVEIMASGRAAEFLSKRFGSESEVNRIHGLHMIYEENRVRLGRTLWSNALEGAGGIPKNIAAYFDLISDFRPEVVISDFESWTYLYAKTHRLPVVSIDNMQIIHRCSHDDDVLEGHRSEFQVTKAFIKGKLPFCNEYFITSFFRPDVRKPHTHLFPPILRSEILEQKPEEGDHLLVYQTGEGYDSLPGTLKKTGVECRIYGMKRDLKIEERDGNLRYMPFSEATFISDLATSRAVIAGGGFTLMGEAVYLHKPMLSVPVGRQFEQVMNGRYLQKLGYGQMAEGLSDPSTVHAFLERVPDCKKALAGYRQNGNEDLLRAVDEFLDRAAAGVA